MWPRRELSCATQSLGPRFRTLLEAWMLPCVSVLFCDAEGLWYGLILSPVRPEVHSKKRLENHCHRGACPQSDCDTTILETRYKVTK
jgi:hypothetical protein